MSRKNSEFFALTRLMPELHETERVQNAVRLNQRLENRAHPELAGVATPKKHERALAEYALRLERTFNSENDRLRERSWGVAINALLIEPEDIPESYWERQKQISRDNAQGKLAFDDAKKEDIVTQLRAKQRISAEQWAGHLSEQAYPTWFKVYAWDGMSRMGRYDQKAEKYHRRDKSTVAPYPVLDTEALEQVYDIVSAQYSDDMLDDRDFLESSNNGNFNTLYSALSHRSTVEAPLNPEDVKGVWKTYTAEDIDAAAEAAARQWCIAGRPDIIEDSTKHGGAFLFYHLDDPQSDETSPLASVAIRLDRHGAIASINGLAGGGGQFVEDVLLSTVDEKVRELPGGDRYLQALEDQRALVAMDAKFHAGEDFTLEELEFIYEINRKIEYVGTGIHDSRPAEFKQHNVAVQKELLKTKYTAFDSLVIVADMSREQMAGNLDFLLTKLTDKQILLAKLTPEEIAALRRGGDERQEVA